MDNQNPSSTHPADARPIPQEAFDWYDEYAHGKKNGKKKKR